MCVSLCEPSAHLLPAGETAELQISTEDQKKVKAKGGEATSAAKEQKSETRTGGRWNPELRQAPKINSTTAVLHVYQGRPGRPTRSALHFYSHRAGGVTPPPPPPPPSQRQKGSLHNAGGSSCLQLPDGVRGALQTRGSVGLWAGTAHKHKTSLVFFTLLSESNHNTPKQESFAQLRLVICADVAGQTPARAVVCDSQKTQCECF